MILHRVEDQNPTDLTSLFNEDRNLFLLNHLCIQGQVSTDNA